MPACHPRRHRHSSSWENSSRVSRPSSNGPSPRKQPWLPTCTCPFRHGCQGEQIRRQDAPCLTGNSNFLGPRRFQMLLPRALGRLNLRGILSELLCLDPHSHPTTPTLLRPHCTGWGRGSGAQACSALRRPGFHSGADTPLPQGYIPNSTERTFYRLPR